MRKPLFAACLLVLLSLLVSACQSSSPPATNIAVVLDEIGENDRSFNEYTLKGAADAARNLGFRLSYTVSRSSADYEKDIEAFAAGGAELILTAGLLLSDATAAVAKRHPGVRFAVVDTAYNPARYQDDLLNVTSLMFAEDEAAYPAGVLAGCLSQTGTVATVAGMELPPVTRYVTGFQNGARSVNPAIRTLNVYIPSFNDAAAGRRAGQAFLDQGADVIFGVGGNTGNGALLAAHEAGRMAVGVDVDQYFTYPEVAPSLITSAAKNVDAAAAAAVEAFGAGELRAGIRLANARNGGVGIAPYHDWDSRIPQACKEKVNAAIEGLRNGRIPPQLPDFP